jgi:cytoskeletal protein RodZ
MAQDVDVGLLTIGQRLRAAREGRGWTLGDLASATHIRENYLARLEAGEVAGLPAEVFVKGFVRICGDTLGLDGPALVDEWQQGSPRPGERAPAAKAPRVGRRGRSSRRAVLLPWLILILIVLVVAGTILALTGVIRL